MHVVRPRQQSEQVVRCRQREDVGGAHARSLAAPAPLGNLARPSRPQPPYSNSMSACSRR